MAKVPNAPVLSTSSKYDVFRADFETERRTRRKAADQSVEERLRRGQGDLLAATNHEGEELDFHALHHTWGGRQ